MNENRPERPYLQFQNQMSRLETVLLLLYLPIHLFFEGKKLKGWR